MLLMCKNKVIDVIDEYEDLNENIKTGNGLYPKALGIYVIEKDVEGAEANKHCYCEEKGLTINPNWTNDIDRLADEKAKILLDEIKNQVIDEYTLELLTKGVL